MATHSSVLPWRIPWTEKPGGLQSIGSQRVSHDYSDFACTHIQYIALSFFNSRYHMAFFFYTLHFCPSGGLLTP